MEEPHRAREATSRGAHADHLAAHAAQVRQSRARREAAAIDDDVGLRREPFAIRAEAQLPPSARKRSRSARIAARGSRWPSPAKKRPLRNRPARSGSSAAMLRFVHALMAARARGEAVDLARVARRRDDERAFARDARNARVPPVERALAESRRPTRARSRPRKRARACRRRSTRRRRQVRARARPASPSRRARRARARCVKPDDARADDERAAHRCRVSAGVEAQSLLRPSQ